MSLISRVVFRVCFASIPSQSYKCSPFVSKARLESQL